jgi:hypothetical protein
MDVDSLTKKYEGNVVKQLLCTGFAFHMEQNKTTPDLQLTEEKWMEAASNEFISWVLDRVEMIHNSKQREMTMWTLISYTCLEEIAAMRPETRTKYNTIYRQFLLAFPVQAMAMTAVANKVVMVGSLSGGFL